MKRFVFEILFFYSHFKSHSNIANQSDQENQEINFQAPGIKNRRSTIAMIRSTLSHSKKVIKNEKKFEIFSFYNNHIIFF